MVVMDMSSNPKKPPTSTVLIVNFIYLVPQATLIFPTDYIITILDIIVRAYCNTPLRIDIIGHFNTMSEGFYYLFTVPALSLNLLANSMEHVVLPIRKPCPSQAVL